MTCWTCHVADLIVLKNLNLRVGKIISIPASVFNPGVHPSYISYFRIDYIPFICDICVCWIMDADGDWINMKYEEFLTCSGPPALAGRSWDSLTREDLGCPPLGMFLHRHEQRDH